MTASQIIDSLANEEIEVIIAVIIDSNFNNRVLNTIKPTPVLLTINFFWEKVKKILLIFLVLVVPTNFSYIFTMEEN